MGNLVQGRATPHTPEGQSIRHRLSCLNLKHSTGIGAEPSAAAAVSGLTPLTPLPRSAEQRIVPRLRLAPLRRGRKVLGAVPHMPLQFVVIKRDAEAGRIRHLDEALV